MVRIVAVCLSEKTGTKKKPVPSALLIRESGLSGDAHSGTSRQVSLLSTESISRMADRGLETTHGMFAENLVVEGLAIDAVAVGQAYSLPSGAVLEVTSIGKICHSRCEIYRQVGDCIMPREGFFARVVEGGEVRPGDLLSPIP